MSNYTIYTENIKDIRRKRVLEVALNILVVLGIVVYVDGDVSN